MTGVKTCRVVPLVLVLGVIGLAGCGSSTSPSSGGSGSTTSTAGAGFISQLNAACQTEKTAAKSAKSVAAGSAVQHKFIQTLETLTPPTALKASLARYVSLLKGNLTAYERHDFTGAKKFVTPLDAVTAKLKAEGATNC